MLSVVHEVCHYQDKSATSFCRHATARASDMFCNFYIVKSHKIDNNSSNNEARENKRMFGILRILEIF